MSVFIDTGIFIAYVNKKDEHHTDATTILEDIMRNRYGVPFTSEYIFNEAVTIALYKANIAKAIDVRDLILGNAERGIPCFMNILSVSRGDFNESWKLFLKYADKKLSFTDCISIELMKKKGIEYIASFDSDFDGIVPRVY
jgi:hypothetical protein